MSVWKRVVSSLGHVTLAICLGGCSPSGDRDPEVEVPLNGPAAVALDADSNLYVADRGNHRIRRIDPSGTVTTVAGSGRSSYDGDGGPATEAALWAPDGVAVDSKGNLYIADTRNNRVRRVDPSGTIATVAGTGESGGGGDGGPAREAQLSYPTGLAVDSDDNLHIADADNGRIRRIDRSGTITTIAGIGDGHFGGDGGSADRARLAEPTGLAVDSESNLYIADTANQRVRRIDRFGTISTVAGTGVGGYGGDGGQATGAQLHALSDVALDSSGNVYIADTWNNRVRRIDPAGMISTVAGNGESSLQGDKGDGGPATQARIDEPMSVAVDSSGNLLIIESGTSSVRLVDPSGTISSVAGRGDRSYSGDGGLATEARLRYPTGVTVDSSGTLYVADMGNFRVRRIDVSGRISTAAYYHRGGTSEFSALFRSSGVAVDSAGRLYVSEVWNHRVHRIDTSGNLSRVAGVAAVESGGDGGRAVKAELYQPHGLAFDQAGNLYVAESQHHRVRRIDPSGIISTVAGTGANGHGWDGQAALEPALSSPSGGAVDMSGKLFVADGGNHRVIRIDPSGIVSTVAGNGMAGYDGGRRDGRRVFAQPPERRGSRLLGKPLCRRQQEQPHSANRPLGDHLDRSRWATGRVRRRRPGRPRRAQASE